MTVSPPESVQIININHQGKMKVNNRRGTDRMLSFSDVKKQLYNEDMIYVKADNSGSVETDLVHSVLKRTVYIFINYLI